MNISDDINHFKVWAASLGCPAEKFPSDEALKSIFRGNQGNTFKQLIDRVKPMGEVQKIKQNILIHKVQKYKAEGGISTKSNKNKIPKELERFDRITKLKSKIAETESRITSSVKQANATLSSTKSKNIQKIKQKHQLETIWDKIVISDAKDKHLLDVSEEELKLKHKLDTIMPVKHNESNIVASQEATSAIGNCFSLLKEYYSVFTEEKLTGNLQAQQNLWKNVKEVLKNIPNHLLWNVLIRIKEDLIQNIAEIDRKQSENENNTELSEKENLENHIAKHCAAHINLFVDTVASEQACEQTRTEYCDKFEDFSKSVEAKMSLLNSIDDDCDEILGDYLIQLSSKSYNKGCLEYIGKEMERKRNEYKMLTLKLENHDQIVFQIRETFDKTETLTAKVQDEIIQLYQIKDKIDYNQKYARYTVQNIRLSSSYNQNTSSNTFNSTACKLDQNSSASTNLLNTAILPPHVSELRLFQEIPIQKLLKFSRIGIFIFNPHIAITSMFDSKANINMLPGHLLTVEGSLLEMRNLASFDEIFKKYLTDTKPEMDFIVVDRSQIESKKSENREKITELLDKTTSILLDTKRQKDKCVDYYKFALQNPLPLAKYVPHSKLFNGHTYREYEQEFNMYYRVLNGADKK